MAVTRKQIDAYNASLYMLYENLQNDLIDEICSHFRVDAAPSAMDEWRFQRLAEMGGFTRSAVQIIAKRTGSAPALVEKAARGLGVATVAADDARYKRARTQGYFKTTPVPAASSAGFQRIIKETTRSATTYLNATHTTALQSSKTAFTNVTNQVYLEVTTGVSTYAEAVRKATRKLADAGITGATYVSKSGRVTRSQIDVAVRRMVVTSNSQLAGQLQINRAKEWGSNFVETSSHMGARPTHAVWQGKIFQLEGRDKYPNFYEECHFGRGDGIKGYNCQHDFYPFFPGLSEPAFDHYNEEKNNAQYAAEQKQRTYENAIRTQKRRAVAAKATGDTYEETAARVKLGKLQKALREHVEANNLYRDPAREQIGTKVTALRSAPAPTARPKRTPATTTPAAPAPRAKVIRAEAIGKAFADMPEAQTAAVSLLASAPADSVGVWNAAQPDIKFDTLTHPGTGAWYSPRTKGLTMNAKIVAAGDPVHAPYNTLFHESAHLIDFKYGTPGNLFEPSTTFSSEYDSGAFNTALTRDVEAWITSQGGDRSAMTFLFKANMRNWGDFMDMVQAATHGRVTGSVGHPKGYFSGRSGKIRQATEAFAQMFAAEISNPESLKNLQTVVPNAYKVFRRMVPALEKKMRKG